MGHRGVEERFGVGVIPRSGEARLGVLRQVCILGGTCEVDEFLDEPRSFCRCVPEQSGGLCRSGAARARPASTGSGSHAGSIAVVLRVARNPQT